MLRIVLFVIASVAIVGCTKHNPNSCCVTAAQCTALGLDQMYPCESGKVCDTTGTCIAAQCATSADCVEPALPVCVGQLCVAVCAGDETCIGVAEKPYCADDGACVACKTNAECADPSPICDASTRSCRRCTYDGDCPGGACLEAFGTCVDESRLIHVTTFGTDTGTCTAAAPCQTFVYAMSKADTVRNVIHIEGGTFDLGASTITIAKSKLYVDGTDTKLTGGANGEPPFAVADFVTGVVFGDVQLETANSNALVVGTSAGLRLFKVALTKNASVVSGSLVAESSTLASVSCTNGTVDIATSSIGGLTTTNCPVIAKRNRFEAASVKVTGGLLDFENNVLTHFDCLNDVMSAQGCAAGSHARFNTFVCTSSLASDGVALYCDSSVDVSSNIFAYNTMHPMGPNGAMPCAAHHSLFDTVAVSAQTGGTGNRTGDASTFFVNKATKDFHLSAGSPALGAAEMGLDVDEDYDGLARPSPAGSAPDIGAYEAP